MRLEDIGLLAVDSSRTRAYLWALGEAGLPPSRAVLIQGGPGADQRHFPATPLFDNRTPARERCATLGIPLVEAGAADPNDPEVARTVAEASQSVWIYAGPGGIRVGSGLLGLGREFLHVHPGRLPAFRGSTTLYYSLLAEGRCEATALFLRPGLDEGPVLAHREFPPPADLRTLDYEYDPYIRSRLLVETLERYRREGDFRPRPQAAVGGRTYYIMHPVLRHAAILGGRLPEDVAQVLQDQGRHLP
jgi:methionyl-tRNA formyltransferase